MIEVPLYCRNLGAVFPPATTVEAKFLETFKVVYHANPFVGAFQVRSWSH